MVADKLRHAGIASISSLLALGAHDVEAVTVSLFCWNVLQSNASASVQNKKPPFGQQVLSQLSGLNLLRQTVTVAHAARGGARELQVNINAFGSTRKVAEAPAPGLSEWTLVVCSRGPKGLIATRRSSCATRELHEIHALASQSH